MRVSFEVNCCGKAMLALGRMQTLDMSVRQLERWVCPGCGRVIDLVDYFLDEELLQEQLEMCEAAGGVFADNAQGFVDLRDQQLKGGERTMADEFDKAQTATLCATKAGNGYKVVVNGVWFYASKRQVMELVNGRQKACTFRTIGQDFETAG